MAITRVFYTGHWYSVIAQEGTTILLGKDTSYKDRFKPYIWINITDAEEVICSGS